MPVVKLFANLRKLAGTKEVPISGSTVGAVLSELIRQNPSLDGVILEAGALRPHVVVMLNGHATGEMDLQVTAQDEIAIFPPIAGG
jgi:MoaD family protein